MDMPLCPFPFQTCTPWRTSLVELYWAGKVEQISASDTNDPHAANISPSPLLLGEVPRDADHLIQVEHSHLFVVVDQLEHLVPNILSLRARGDDDLTEVVVRSGLAAQLRPGVCLLVAIPRGRAVLVVGGALHAGGLLTCTEMNGATVAEQRPAGSLSHHVEYQVLEGRDEHLEEDIAADTSGCLLYTSPSPRDRQKSR